MILCLKLSHDIDKKNLLISIGYSDSALSQFTHRKKGAVGRGVYNEKPQSMLEFDRLFLIDTFV